MHVECPWNRTEARKAIVVGILLYVVPELQRKSLYEALTTWITIYANLTAMNGTAWWLFAMLNNSMKLESSSVILPLFGAF